jgi:putative DNA primase/helicase
LDVRGNRHPTEKADLHGKRLIVCNETDQTSTFAETTLKELTGGDTVKARRMREDFWSFRPSHTLMLVTNHKPIVRGTDHGVWRRLRLLPFTQTFWDRAKGETGPDEYEADPRLKDKLRPELAGIVSWLVRGCIAWQRQGLGQPAEVTAATADYRGSMDVLAAFLDECCTLGEGFTVKATDIRARYEEWCKGMGERPISGRRFGEQLRERGVTKRVSNGTWYSGVAIQ